MAKRRVKQIAVEPDDGLREPQEADATREARLKRNGLWKEYTEFLFKLKTAELPLPQAKAIASAMYDVDSKGIPLHAMDQIVIEAAGGNISVERWCETIAVMHANVEADAEQKKSKVQLADGVPAEFGLLLQAASGKRCAVRRAIEWVVENIMLDPHSIDPDSVPSCQAVSFLWMATKDDASKDDFMGKFGTKLLPTGAALDQEGYDHDGRADAELLDHFQRGIDAFLPSGPEGHAEEHPVPA